jgi:hypothetical protein
VNVVVSAFNATMNNLAGSMTEALGNTPIPDVTMKIKRTEGEGE